LNWDVLVAVGTLLLATATFLAVYQGRRQVQMLYRQLNLQTAQQIPHLFIKQVTFEKDAVKLDIENATDAPALWTGLVTRFFFINERYFDAQRGGHEISWGQAVKLKEEGKTVYGKYYLPAPNKWPKLVYNGKEVRQEAAVSFFAPQGVSTYFPPKTTIQVKTAPRFAISWAEKDRQAGKGFEYGAFREFLLENNIDEVAVSMSLICKDAAEKPLGQADVASFVIKTASDKSLADSSAHAQRFDFLPLSHQEYLSDKIWVTEESYYNTYSNWHIFE
jgi:hypothetical protein